MDIDVDIAARPTTISTRSPHLEKPANTQHVNVVDGRVDIVDFVDIKMHHEMLTPPDGNSVLI